MRISAFLVAATTALAGCSSSSTPATCTSFTYSAWGTCQADDTQTRTVESSSPAGCTGGEPVTSQACTYLPPASAQPPATNSGFMAIAAVGELHKLYVPAHSASGRPEAQVAVVDAATPHGQNGVLKYVVLGLPDTNGLAVVVGASGSDVVVGDRTSPTVYFLDAASDAVKGRVDLPPEAVQRPNSDRSGYVAGVAVDSARRRAWVAVSFGIIEYDLDTRLEVTTYRVPGSENFAYDPNARRLLAPYYPCVPETTTAEECVTSPAPGGADLTDGLTLVDLASGAGYSFADPAAPDPAAPLGREVDSAAIDFGLGVAAVAVENPSLLQVLDLAAPTFDATAKRWHAPAAEFPLPGAALTVMAADATTHVLTVAQEYGPDVLFVDLAKAKDGAGELLPVTMPDRPDGQPWSAQGDPVGATSGIVAGKPYAFLVADDRHWVARIDLTAVRGLLDGGTGDFASMVSYFSVPESP